MRQFIGIDVQVCLQLPVIQISSTKLKENTVTATLLKKKTRLQHTYPRRLRMFFE